MTSDITPNDIEETITLLENLGGTKFFKNSSIIFGMIEALEMLQNDVSKLQEASDDSFDDQEALDSVLDLYSSEKYFKND